MYTEMDEIRRNITQLQDALRVSYLTQPAVSANAATVVDGAQDSLMQLQQRTFQRQQALLEQCFVEIERAAAVAADQMRVSTNASQINDALQVSVQRLNMELAERRERSQHLEDELAAAVAERDKVSADFKALRDQNSALQARHEMLLHRARQMRQHAVQFKQDAQSARLALSERNQALVQLSALRQETQARQQDCDQQLEEKQREIQALRAALEVKESQICQLRIPQDTDFHQQYGNLMKQCRDFNEEIQRLKAENEKLRQRKHAHTQITGKIGAIGDILRKARRKIALPAREELEEIKMRYPDIDFDALVSRCKHAFEAHLPQDQLEDELTPAKEQEIIRWIEENIDGTFAQQYGPERTGTPLFEGDNSEISLSAAICYVVFLLWVQKAL